MLQKYISEYIGSYRFTPCDHISLEIYGIKAEIACLEYDDSHNYREKAHITLQKEGLKYECECIDTHDWKSCFFPILLKGQMHICFRKSLYGFTLLDANTLRETYDYFPAKVLDGEESFIIVDAKNFGDLIVFGGCYWGCPYTYFVYNYSEKRFLDLWNAFSLNDPDFEIEIKKDSLILTCPNDTGAEIRISITENELHQLLKDKGSSEF